MYIRNKKGLTAMKNFVDNFARRLIREEMYHDDSNEYYEDDNENYRCTSNAPVGSYAWLMGY